MKKMLICCGALCMTMLLFCVSAFAAVDVKSSDDTVTVTVNETGEKGPEITVNKKSGVDAENLYLVMVQEGTELPTSENLYYMDVDKFSSAFEMKAYPKDGFLTAGKTYTVYLSDWSAAGNGARKAVATVTIGGDGPVVYGDVNGDGNVNSTDRGILARYLAHWPDYGPDKTDNRHKVIESNSDLNGDGKVNASDRGILARYLAHWPDYPTLPVVKK